MILMQFMFQILALKNVIDYYFNSTVLKTKIYILSHTTKWSTTEMQGFSFYFLSIIMDEGQESHRNTRNVTAKFRWQVHLKVSTNEMCLHFNLGWCQLMPPLRLSFYFEKVNHVGHGEWHSSQRRWGMWETSTSFSSSINECQSKSKQSQHT